MSRRDAVAYVREWAAKGHIRPLPPLDPECCCPLDFSPDCGVCFPEEFDE